MVAVAEQDHHGDLHLLGQLAHGRGDHRRGAAEGIPGLGVEDHHVAVFRGAQHIADQGQIGGEFPGADAADIPQQPLPVEEAVDGHHKVGPGRPDGPGGHHEIHEGVVVAQQEIGGLDALHAVSRQPVAMLPQHGDGQQTDQPAQMLPLGRPGGIEARDLVEHGNHLSKDRFSIRFYHVLPAFTRAGRQLPTFPRRREGACIRPGAVVH